MLMSMRKWSCRSCMASCLLSSGARRGKVGEADRLERTHSIAPLGKLGLVNVADGREQDAQLGMVDEAAPADGRRRRRGLKPALRPR